MQCDPGNNPSKTGAKADSGKLNATESTSRHPRDRYQNHKAASVSSTPIAELEREPGGFGMIHVELEIPGSRE